MCVYCVCVCVCVCARVRVCVCDILKLVFTVCNGRGVELTNT